MALADQGCDLASSDNADLARRIADPSGVAVRLRVGGKDPVDVAGRVLMVTGRLVRRLGVSHYSSSCRCRRRGALSESLPSSPTNSRTFSPAASRAPFPAPLLIFLAPPW